MFIPPPGFEPGTFRFQLTNFHPLRMQRQIVSTAERSTIELGWADSEILKLTYKSLFCQLFAFVCSNEIDEERSDITFPFLEVY